MTARAAVGVLLAALLVAPAAHAALPRGAVPLEAFPTEQIAIETRHSFRRLLFRAWRADTPATREQGLMYVEDAQVRPDQAMIFLYDPPQYVAMWMKNTLLALDMLFVDPRGCVVSVQERARPLSLDTIASGRPVVLVVELKAGTIARHGIRAGDRVLRLDAGWPRGDAGCAMSD